MKKIILTSLIAFASLLIFAQSGDCDGTGPNGSGSSSGTSGQGNSGSGNGDSTGTPSYDITLEQTISGEILTVIFSDCDGEGGNGYQLVILSDGVEVPVVMAPTAFLLLQNLTFSTGDFLTLTGIFATNQDGIEIFIVRILTFENGDEVTFRDEDGIPFWRGIGRN